MSSNEPEELSRRKQFVQAYKMTKAVDPRLGLYMFLAFVLGAAVGGLVFWLLPPDGGVLKWILLVTGALLFGGLAALILFTRRAQRAMYKTIEGRPGAAASAVGMLRRGWSSSPGVAFTKQMDMIHRVVGPPGVVLIGEGNPGRLKTLLANERRKYERVAPDAPVHEIIVGDGEGQIPLTKLVKSVQKLPKGLKPRDMTDTLNRLKAIDANRPPVPMPKGPIPTSMKGMRGNQRGR